MQNFLSAWSPPAGRWVPGVGRVSRLLPAHAGEHLDRWMICRCATTEHTGGEKRFIEPERGDVPQQEKDEWWFVGAFYQLGTYPAGDAAADVFPISEVVCVEIFALPEICTCRGCRRRCATRRALTHWNFTGGGAPGFYWFLNESVWLQMNPPHPAAHTSCRWRPSYCAQELWNFFVAISDKRILSILSHPRRLSRSNAVMTKKSLKDIE